MKLGIVKGYIEAIFSGVVLVCMVVLVAFQWANVAKFSLFGRSYDIMVEANRYVGGVNTALLMLFSAVGGIAAWMLVRLLIVGLRDISRGRRQQASELTERRLAELEQSAGKAAQDES